MTCPALRCAACGRAPRDDESAIELTWMREVDARGRATWVCAECTRTNVRAVEAKLDQQYW